MTPNEVRKELGLGASDGLDDFFAGPNMLQPENTEEGGEDDDSENGASVYDPDAVGE